ncbi:MAG: hypothetical protein ACREA4_10735 [Nitrososphaera sp.]
MVWAAFLVATAFYLWIPQLLIEQLRFPERQPLAGTIRLVLWTIVLIQLGFLIWWKRKYLTRDAILRRAGEIRWMPMLVRGHRSPAEETAARVISWYLSGKIVAFAIAESFAIYGAFLAYIGRYFGDQYFLSLVCVLLLAYLYPRRSFMTELLGELYSQMGN